MHFNQSQIQAIRHKEGPMMVLAGPGSGKTMVITHRVKWLIERENINPSNILVVTFTKAAADEMRQRFLSIMDMQHSRVSFGTFHAIFFSILKHAYGYSASNIIKDDHKYRIMREIMDDFEVEVDNINEHISEVLQEIGVVKGNMMSIEQYYATSCAGDLFRKIYDRYQKKLVEERLIDFEDMMVYTYELFCARHDILKAWQEKFQYILIDEFQDINILQYKIISLLAKPKNHLFIVGDDDQSIYGFRGAKPEIMLNFHKDYPTVQTIQLSVNYRCQAAIVRAAARVIGNNQHRFEKEIISAKEESVPIDIRMFKSPPDEYAAIIKEIMLAKKRGRAYKDIAILFRTNMQARALIEKLMAYNIPFQMQDSLPNIYKHWITQDLLAYIYIGRGDQSRNHFLRIMNRPNRFISRQSLEMSKMTKREWLLFYKDKDWMQERIEKFYDDCKMIGTMAPYAAIQYIRHAVGYQKFLEEYAKERHMDYQELVDVLDELQESSKNYLSFESWFEHMENYTEFLLKQARNQKEQTIDGVVLATMHHAKGLEYEQVFIVDANEKITPHQKALLEKDIEEERRMFYVAMTRAKEYLHIFFIKDRYGREQEMSRFVSEVLIDYEAFNAGMRISHKTYGLGKVKKVDAQCIYIVFDKPKMERKLDLKFCLTHQMLKVIES